MLPPPGVVRNTVPYSRKFPVPGSASTYPEQVRRGVRTKSCSVPLFKATAISYSLPAVTGTEMRLEVLPSASLLAVRSEEHTSELQSLRHLVCRLLLEKTK